MKLLRMQAKSMLPYLRQKLLALEASLSLDNSLHMLPGDYLDWRDRVTSAASLADVSSAILTLLCSIQKDCITLPGKPCDIPPMERIFTTPLGKQLSFLLKLNPGTQVEVPTVPSGQLPGSCLAIDTALSILASHVLDQTNISSHLE